MKNLMTMCCAVSLLIFVGLACKNNPLAKYTKQYHCAIAGEAEPNTSEEYVKRAGKHIEENNYSAAFNECAFGAASEAIRLDSQNIDAIALRGFLYFSRAKSDVDRKDYDSAKRNFEAALDDMNKAVSARPDYWLYYETRSSIYNDSGFLDPDSEKTLQDLTKAIELAPIERSKVSLYIKRGDIYAEKKDYETAVKDYTEAINREPKNEEFYSKRSQIYYKLGKEDLSTADDMKVFQLKDEKEGKDIKKTTDKSSNDGKIPKTISGGVLNGKAVELPKPVYPAAARAVKASGAVNVQVTVDEKGNITVANAVSGHPLLRQPAVAAARQAKFKPTLLSGTPVKVTGVIEYKFVPEQIEGFGNEKIGKYRVMFDSACIRLSFCIGDVLSCRQRDGILA